MRDRIQLARARGTFTSYQDAETYLKSKKDYLEDGEALLAKYRPEGSDDIKYALGICYNDYKTVDSEKSVSVFSGDVDDIVRELLSDYVHDATIELKNGDAIIGSFTLNQLENNEIDFSTLYGVFNEITNGLVPAPGSITGKYLRDDGTWVDLNSFRYEVYADLSEVRGPSETVLYLIGPDAAATGDQYIEYVYKPVTEEFVQIGTTAIDLSDYARLGDIPYVSDSTIFLTNGDDSLGSFSLNQNTSKTINLRPLRTIYYSGEGISISNFTVNQSVATDNTLGGIKTGGSDTFFKKGITVDSSDKGLANSLVISPNYMATGKGVHFFALGKENSDVRDADLVPIFKFSGSINFSYYFEILSRITYGKYFISKNSAQYCLKNIAFTKDSNVSDALDDVFIMANGTECVVYKRFIEDRYNYNHSTYQVMWDMLPFPYASTAFDNPSWYMEFFDAAYRHTAHHSATNLGFDFPMYLNKGIKVTYLQGIDDPNIIPYAGTDPSILTANTYYLNTTDNKYYYVKSDGTTVTQLTQATN